MILESIGMEVSKKYERKKSRKKGRRMTDRMFQLDPDGCFVEHGVTSPHCS